MGFPWVGFRRVVLTAILLEGIAFGWSLWRYVQAQAAYRALQQGTPETLDRVIARSPRYRAWAFLALGNRALQEAERRGDPVLLQEALFYYRSALRGDPALWPAKRNYEVVARRLRPPLRSQERGGPTMEFWRVLPS
ncbi:MAG: hypothetical protein RMK16_00910, partial [Acidobacteriota bacterium]|nr:hypothetical protein [Acidobacteriota bacterium]